MKHDSTATVEVFTAQAATLKAVQLGDGIGASAARVLKECSS
jgi:hypothetical protein